MGKPSTIYNGSLLAFTEPAPRTRISNPPPGCALFWRTYKPAAFPTNTCPIEDAPAKPISFVFTVETAPVKSRFFIVPYPITITSSSILASSVKMILRYPSPDNATSCVAYPIYETTSVPSSGTSSVYAPSMSVIPPIVVFFTRIFAPMTGKPSESITWPLII